MSFDYEKIKHSGDHGSMWASYSDLFMMLSLVFLLLYVTASLRSGTNGVQSEQLRQEALAEAADLREQIRVYNTLRNDYLEKGASPEEQQMYEGLMDKLVLLQEEAKDEKNKLRQAARENEVKEKALNKYQQMVRNIINTNLLSSARLKRRDLVIDENKVEISQLQSNVQQKEQMIAVNEQKIQSVNSQLEKKIKQLNQAHKNQKLSKANLKKEITKLREENEHKVAALRQRNEQVAQELQSASQMLVSAKKDLNAAHNTISAKDKALSEIVNEKNQISQKMGALQGDFDAQMKKERKAFDAALNAQQLSAAGRLAKEAEFRAMAESRQSELGRKLAAMQGQYNSVQGQLDGALMAKQKADAEIGNLKQKEAQLSSDLRQAKDIIEAKKMLAQRLKNNLAKAGIGASVDEKTGDVVLKFGEEYFDTGQAQLKPGMKNIIHKFMPVYTQSLFSDKKVAEKIRNVEIIGYASPTYKGKFVDPVSLRAADKEAVNYNLDLSYYRARSIFDYIFDTKKLQYNYQRDLLPKVKVTGRSFLAGQVDRDLASGEKMSQAEYCRRYDCKKSQRVIIRFDLGN